MRANTVPTVITDKNGKITTVHRKSDGVSSSKKTIPHATITPAPAKDFESLKELPYALSFYAWHKTKERLNRIGKSRREAMMATLREDSFEKLNDMLTNDENTRNSVLNRCMEDKSFSHLNNIAVIAPLAQAGDADAPVTLHSVALGFQMYRELIPGQKPELIDWSSAENSDVPLALGKASLELDSKYSSGFQGNLVSQIRPSYIYSTELVNLITRRPQDADRIIQILNDRKLPVGYEHEIANLEGVLDQEIASTSLTSGAL